MHLDAIKPPGDWPVDLAAALDASGVVGVWSWSGRAERCILDAGAAEVLAGDAALAGRPVSLETAKACVHPEDRPALLQHIRALYRQGGLFVAEYRTVSPAGQVRRILDRGRVTGGAHRGEGHGILIDVTEGGRADSGGRAEPTDALAAAVDAAIECRDALDGVDDSELRLLVDMLLLQLGRKIARFSRGPVRTASGVRRGH